MPNTSNAERLRQIAEEIRGLPKAFETFSNHEYEVAVAAGGLISEAIDLGAFTGPRYIKLRLLIQRQKERSSQDWDRQFGAWLEAITCLVGGTGTGCRDEWELACGPIADAVEAEADRVDGPPDKTAFRPASELCPEKDISLKKAKAFCVKNHIHCENRTGRRLWIHAGDWTAYWAKQHKNDFDSLDEGDRAPITGTFLEGVRNRYEECHAKKRDRN